MTGVWCGPGWKDLYGPVIDLILKHGGRVLQVKEKFGGLRIYYDETDIPESMREMVRAAVDSAEQRSFETCEVCGKPGTLRNVTRYWVKTVCDEHAPKEATK